MMDLCIQDSEKCVRHGIWKLRVHTFQPQYLLSDHLSILKWFWLLSVPNGGNIRILRELFVYCVIYTWLECFWRLSIRIQKALTSYFHLSKPLKWSLKYIKWLLSIEVLTFRDFEVISWVTSYWHILKWYLSDHLISLLEWKYGI